MTYTVKRAGDHPGFLGAAFVVDAELRVWTCNRAAREALPSRLVHRRDFSEIFPGAWFGMELGDVRDAFRRTLETGVEFHHRPEAGDGGATYASSPWSLRRVSLPRGPGVSCSFVTVPASKALRRPVATIVDTGLLGRLSCELLGQQDSRGLYEKFVDAALTIMRASHACLQIHHPERGPDGALRMLATRGFGAEDERVFEWVDASATTICAEALRRRARVVAPRLEECEFVSGSLERRTYRHAGVESGQTTPLVSHDGRIVGMISTFWRCPHQPSAHQLRTLDLLARQVADLIERTATLESLRRSEEQLREADRRREEFLAMLGHELRDPIAPIRIGLELIRRAGDDVASIASVRSMMERQLGHLVRLIDDLLDVSRIQSGKVQLRRQPTTLREVVGGAIEAAQAAGMSKRVTFDVGLPNEAVWLDVDPTRLVQVLANVLHNAVKFSPEGGRVALTAALDRAPNADAHELRIVVADRGVGISAEFLPRMFDYFTQDERAREDAHAGLGIGLALARRLIEMHGGTIAAESAGPGLGSAITLRLPVIRPHPVEPAPSVANGEGVTGRRVLVVDDNRDSAKAMKRLVDVMGGDCRVAFSGTAGLEAVAAFRPELVLLDISMPDLSGIEVCRRIRTLFGAEICVVALTGWGQERDQRAAAEAGFDLHLTKPVDPDLLESLIAAPRACAAQIAAERPNGAART